VIKQVVKKFTKFFIAFLYALPLVNCGGENSQLFTVKQKEIISDNQNLVVEKPISQNTQVIETQPQIEEKIEKKVEKSEVTITEEIKKEPVIEETIIETESPKQIDYSNLQLHLISQNKFDIMLGSNQNLEFEITDGSKNYFIDNGMAIFSSSEKILKIGEISKGENNQYLVELQTRSIGEIVLTLIFLENPTEEKSLLIRVIPKSLEIEVLESCPTINGKGGFKALADENTGDATGTVNKEVSINSRIPVIKDEKKSKVSILYKKQSESDEFAPKTIFFRDDNKNLIATIGYSKSLVNTPFYIIYQDSDDNTICSKEQYFPVFKELNKGDTKVEIEESMPIIGGINKPKE
jgi:hypothetical protein